MSDKKKWCYQTNCGPVVRTGFHLDQYYVCKTCKEEITDHLRGQIEHRDSALSPDTATDESIWTWGV